MKINSIYLRYFIYLVIALVIITGIASAGRINPAVGYCEGLGYQYEYDVSTGMGECIMPDGTSVLAWKFLLGEVAQEYSYCEQNNLELKIVTDATICMELGIETCAVCKFPDGTEIEVTKAMDLDLITGSCGDKICDIGETYENCQEDCPSGTIDGYCDEISDGTCDEDCVIQQIPSSDVDCPYCGDGICKLEESYKNCQADCPSGFKDNYCDSISDGRCDPDCIDNQDADCKSKLSFWQRFINWLKSLFR
ncbi:MAG: hypothetical protein HQ569_01195 [Actinobacteria bacterium]|nr:hypothetical protein [Actinomycetota bacterium]